MTGIGIAGYGYWGPNLARAFFVAEGARGAAIRDQWPRAVAEPAWR
jgi:hypothetical protein